MKRYLWFGLAAIWVLIAVLNAGRGRGGVVIGFNAFAAAVFAALGVAQILTDRKGDDGKKAMRWAETGATAVAVLALLAVLFA